MKISTKKFFPLFLLLSLPIQAEPTEKGKTWIAQTEQKIQAFYDNPRLEDLLNLHEKFCEFDDIAQREKISPAERPDFPFYIKDDHDYKKIVKEIGKAYTAYKNASPSLKGLIDTMVQMDPWKKTILLSSDLAKEIQSVQKKRMDRKRLQEVISPLIKNVDQLIERVKGDFPSQENPLPRMLSKEREMKKWLELSPVKYVFQLEIGKHEMGGDFISEIKKFKEKIKKCLDDDIEFTLSMPWPALEKIAQEKEPLFPAALSQKIMFSLSGEYAESFQKNYNLLITPSIAEVLDSFRGVEMAIPLTQFDRSAIENLSGCLQSVNVLCAFPQKSRRVHLPFTSHLLEFEEKSQANSSLNFPKLSCLSVNIYSESLKEKREAYEKMLNHSYPELAHLEIIGENAKDFFKIFPWGKCKNLIEGRRDKEKPLSLVFQCLLGADQLDEPFHEKFKAKAQKNGLTKGQLIVKCIYDEK